MVKHPKNKLARRSIEAHVLENRLFRQRIKNGSKKHIEEEINEKEAEDELVYYRHNDLSDQLNSPRDGLDLANYA